jgi:hypothetical protein
MSEQISRGRFLVRGGMVLGAVDTAHVLPDTLLRRSGAGLRMPTAAATTLCFDPIPDPGVAGFIQEGTKPLQSPGDPPAETFTCNDERLRIKPRLGRSHRVLMFEEKL